MSTFTTVLQANGISPIWIAKGGGLDSNIGLGFESNRIRFHGSFLYNSVSHTLVAEFDTDVDFAPDTLKNYRITLEEITE